MSAAVILTGVLAPGGPAHNGGMGGIRPDDRIQQTLTRIAQAVRDRFMRWRGRPPEEGGVREPRRPRPTLPAAAVALSEPRTGLRRLLWFK